MRPRTDPDVAWRRARRQAAKEHHPDVGGEPGALHAALAAVDRDFGRRPSSRPVVVVRHSRRRRLCRWTKRLARRLAARRPGAPRWIDL